MQTFKDVTDANLVSRFKEGDQKAFDRIVERYQQKVFALACRIMGNEEEALDISQETFIKVYEKIHSYHGGAALFTWIYRITVNLAINALRKKKRRATLHLELKTMYPGDVSWNPSSHLHSSNISHRVDKAVAKLPAKQKMVFILRQLEGLQYNEIAQVLNRSVGAVKATYFHATRNLRNELADLMEE